MYGECGQRGIKPAVVRDRDDGWNLRLFVAVLLRITFDHERYMSQSWDAADSGEPKTMINLATSLCTHYKWAGAGG